MAIQRYAIGTGRKDDNGSVVTHADHLAVVKRYRDALEALVAVDDGIGEGDSFETAAQTVNDLDAAMQQARALLAEAKGEPCN